jgi:ribonuclease P protein component
MLPKEKRLRSEKDFKRVYQRGSFFSLRLFNINYAFNRLGFSRLAFVVNKKVAKKAVVRNEVKRRYREAFRQLYGTLPAGYDVVVTIKRESLGVKLDEISAEAKKVAEKMGPKR